MEYCLITKAPLDSSTKVEHTILHSLGGRITSRRLTSSNFNQKCGNTVDLALTDMFKHIFAMLSPATISGANPGNVLYTSLDKSRKYYLNNGFTTLAQDIIIRGKDGRPAVAYSTNEKAIRKMSSQASLTISNIERVALPVENNTAYRNSQLLGTDIEIAIIKCIVLTIEEMTIRKNLPRITTITELREAISLLKEYIIDEDHHSQKILRKLSNIYYGIQLNGPERISKILTSHSVFLHPFDHIIIVSGNVATKTIDVLWSIAGIEVHGVRLCSSWDGFDFTYIIQNSILKNSAEPDLIHINVSSGVLCQECQLRSIQPASNGEFINPFIPSAISLNRQRSYINAIRYVEMNCDDHVYKEFIEPTKYIPHLNVKESIFNHLSPLYNSKRISEIWNADSGQLHSQWESQSMSEISADSPIWRQILKTYRTILAQLTTADENPNYIFSHEINAGRYPPTT